jgi:hypothetical protein
MTVQQIVSPKLPEQYPEQLVLLRKMSTKDSSCFPGILLQRPETLELCRFLLQNTTIEKIHDIDIYLRQSLKNQISIPAS